MYINLADAAFKPKIHKFNPSIKPRKIFKPISKQAYKAYLRIYRKLKRHGLMCEEFRTRDSFSTDNCWMQVGASLEDLAKDETLPFIRAHIVNVRFH